MVAHTYKLIIALLLTLCFGPTAHADEAQDALVEQGVAAYDDGDYQRAKDILLPLAETGHPKAMNMVGLMYSKGFGYSQNRQMACDWYERSAKKGYASAQSNLARCFIRGDGRPINVEESLFWDEQAALQGNKSAQAALAGYFVKRDRETYLYWAHKAIANGSKATAALMWLNGDQQDIVDISPVDITCVVVMIGWLKKPSDYCE